MSYPPPNPPIQTNVNYDDKNTYQNYQQTQAPYQQGYQQPYDPNQQQQYGYGGPQYAPPPNNAYIHGQPQGMAPMNPQQQPIYVQQDAHGNNAGKGAGGIGFCGACCAALCAFCLLDAIF